MSDSKIRVRCGLLFRPRLRAVFDFHGMTWVEHKGWLDSHFIASGTPQQARDVMDELKRIGGRYE